FTARHDGFCWATVFNKRYSDVYPATNDDSILPDMVTAVYSVTNWPDVDLFNRVVTTLADSGPGSLRAAVSSLAGGPAGSTITFAPGLSGQTITLTSGKLLLTNSLTIDASALPGGIRISGNHSSRVFEVASNSIVVLNALAIVDGFSTSEGGGVRSSGTLTMNQCTLSGNTVSWDGGGLCVIEGTATLNACTVSGNTATQNSGGGLSNPGGLLTLNQCTITGNSAFGFGGGIDFGWDGGSVALNQCTLTGNSAGVGNPAGGYGGGIYHVIGSLDVYNSIVAGNIQTDGINVRGLVNYTGGSVIAGDPRLEPLGNYGGLTQTMPPRLDSPALDAGDDAATNRFSGDQRGMPCLRGTHMDVGAVELNYHVVTANSDSGPGSLRQLVSAALPHTALIFAGGMSNILLTSGPITLSNPITITIDACSLAGGIRISGNNNSRAFNVPSGSTVVLNALTITDGFASDTGGGILNNGTLTVNRCSLFGNNAVSSGGAIASPAGTLTLNQCTLASNAVVALGTGGGAISFGSAGGTLTVNQSTLSGNVAPVGAGIYKGGGSLAVFNSIVAGNNQDSGNDIQGSGTYSGVNLTSGDPLLAPLGNYGGPTPTRPPLPGSPAIDAATNGPGFTIDQRGFPRVNGFYADLGAVEFPFGDVARWRMGEIDPGVADLAPLGGYTSNSVAGSPNLSVTGGSYSSSVAPEASTYAHSRWSVYFNGFGVAPVVSTRTDNFGLELWVKPFASFTGTNCMAYNGRFDTDGWGIFRINNSYVATIGGLLNGAGTFGSKPATPSVWTHLALVRDNGISTFYVNGVPSGS